MTNPTFPEQKELSQLYARINRSSPPKYPYLLRTWLNNEFKDVWNNVNNSHYSKKTPTKTNFELAKESYHLFENKLEDPNDSSYNYSRGRSKQPTAKELTSDAVSLFEKYQKLTPDWEDEGDLLFEDGFDKFFTDVLKITPTTLNKTIFAYVFSTKSIGDIEKDEFTNALVAYGVSTHSGIQKWFSKAVMELCDPKIYLKDLYNGCFFYANDSTVRRSISISRAFRFWEVLLPLLGQFKTYPDWKLWLNRVADEEKNFQKYKAEYDNFNSQNFLKNFEQSSQNNDVMSPESVDILYTAPPLLPRRRNWLVRPDNDQNDVEIKIDLWSNFLDFVLVMQDDYINNYKFNGDDAWNSALDEFVLDFLDLEYIDGVQGVHVKE